MFATRILQKHSFKSLSSLLHCRAGPSKSVSIPKALSSNAVRPNDPREYEGLSSPATLGPFEAWRRAMSTSPPRGRSMRSKVERRMKKETGKTMREVRRAKKIQKKLMTENERLVFNLKRAKKKVAVLLQKLKKYELPELPPPLHDPEILTPEQLQAYRKIGFKNKNYVPVGVRGVFGGVVQNMHMHWKFHETVQVCCDNFPKEKIKEMATVLARLSGGIVINVHNGKTIIMYRGRNYRQPKNLIPFNTLTKRKALFKARFEQALESQKLNIKKIEQQLRRSGINPEDPAATASIQRVASSFFNAIDNKDGTPYVFHEKRSLLLDEEADSNFGSPEPSDEREQAELDRFIAEIEDAAEREWAAEEAAEKEGLGRLRYWNKEEYSGRFRRSETYRDDRYGDGGDEVRGSRTRSWKDTRSKPRRYGSDDDEDDDDSDADDDSRESEKVSRRDWGKQGKFRKSTDGDESEAFSDLENAMWKSDDNDDDDRHDSSALRARNHSRSEGDDDNDDGEESSYDRKAKKHGIVPYESKWERNETGRPKNSERRKWGDEDFDSGDSCSDSDSRAPMRVRNYNSLTSDNDDNEDETLERDSD